MGYYQVQKAGLAGDTWKTICNNENESYVREIYQKQLRLYSIGRFRLLAPDGKIMEEGRAMPIFSDN